MILRKYLLIYWIYLENFFSYDFLTRWVIEVLNRAKRQKSNTYLKIGPKGWYLEFLYNFLRFFTKISLDHTLINFPLNISIPFELGLYLCIHHVYYDTSKRKTSRNYNPMVRYIVENCHFLFENLVNVRLIVFLKILW